MKNQKNWVEEWYLDRSGKIVGAIICLLTFAVGMAAFGVLAYLVAQFGTELLWNPDQGYYGTTYYENALKCDVTEILENALEGYWNASEGKFSVVEVGDAALIHEYDMDLVQSAYEREEIPSDLAALNIYEKYHGGEPRAGSSMFCYYSKAYALLTSLKNKNAYVYMTNDAIIDMMERRGYRNSGYCISSRFSEDAIFLFTGVTKLGGENSKSDDNYETSTEEYYNYSMIAQKSGKTDNSDTVYATNRYPNLDKVGYLVYEPSTQMFYTPWNNFFQGEPYNVYRVEDILNAVAENGVTVGNTDSILFPMLWAKTCTISDAFAYSAKEQMAIEQAKQSPLMEQDRFSYYIKSGNKTCSNVDNVKQIEQLREHYRLVDGVSQETGCSFHIAKLLQDSDVAKLVEQFPRNTEILIGLNVDDISVRSGSAAIRGKVLYTFYGQYGGALGVGMAICLILVLVQGVYLVHAAGRKLEDEEGLYLHRTDHIPTEVWFVMYAAGAFCTILIADGVMDYICARESIEMAEIAGLSAGGWLPLGLILLLFVMSLSRRIKDKNLWKESILRSVVQGTDSKKRMLGGVERLTIAMICYVLCNIFILLLYGWYDGEYSIIPEILILCFLIVQVIAAIGMGAIVNDARRLLKGMDRVKRGELQKVSNIKERTLLFRELADGVSHISDGLQTAIENSLKDERMKTELITNVSHDLKTPLTSIINYINLLKTQQMPTKEAEHYVEVLDGKAQRLKHLTEDLVEAAKATSGNIELEMMPLAFDELMKQSIGEFEDKYAMRKLNLVAAYPEKPVIILADGRRMFRVIENVLQNAYKYSLEGTRVYADLTCKNHMAAFTLKNVSAAELNISTEELMERFTRGDSARSTEGSGLGLSIARDLTKLQGGQFEIYLDGDLFKVIITFPEYIENVEKDT